MPIDIHLPSTPRHLKVTPTMIDDFLIDPVLGARVILGVHLDAFQAAGLKLCWWYPWFLDYSGLGTGKTFSRGFVPIALRCVLMEDQVWCAYYQTFDAGKRIFWPYFRQFDSRVAPLFCAQMGKVDVEGDVEGKDNTRGPACYTQWFKNESRIMMPAPNWLQEAKGQAGDTFNGVYIDEWTKVESMTKRGETVGGIDKQILGRVRRKNWNQYHRLWTNHRIFSATAEAPSHAGYRRFATFKSRVAAGDADYAMFTSSFKDFSQLKDGTGKPFRDVVPDWAMLKGNKTQWTRAHFLREGLGIWARETKGWYSEEALDRCVQLGFANKLEPICTRAADVVLGVQERLGVVQARYFLGVDSAPAQQDKSDDGALACLRLRPKPGLGAEPTSNHGDWLWEFVWAYRVRGNLKRIAKDAEQGSLFARTLRHWSGLIHTKHMHFHFDGIMLDPGAGGGGSLLLPELEATRQLINGIETEVVPIASPLSSTGGNAHYIVSMFLRREMTDLWPILKGDDNLIHAAHGVFQEMVEHGGVLWPLPFNERPREETSGWELERQWALKNLDAMRHQLMQIAVETNDDGSWRMSQNNALKFMVAAGKKDLAYAGLMAVVRAVLWLKRGELEFSGGGGQDSGFYVL